MDADIALLKAIQSLQSGFFDTFFQIVTYIGSDVIAFIVVGALFWCIDKNKGEFVIFALLLSYLVNNALKDIIKRPRPIGLPDVISHPGAAADVLVPGGKYPYSYSFPSGHAQGTGTLLTSLSILVKKWWAVMLFMILLLLVMVSRPYLGVHFPTDVVCGAILGVGMAFLAQFLMNKRGEKRFALYLWAAAILFPVILFAGSDLAKSIGGFSGFAVGMFLERKFVNFSVNVVWWKKILRLVVGCALVMGIRLGCKAIFPDIVFFSYLRYFILILFATFIFPWCFTKCKM